MDPSLMRGTWTEGEREVPWVRCCICGALHVHPCEGLAVDTEGTRWDVCSGQCARDAGIVEAHDLDG